MKSIVWNYYSLFFRSRNGSRLHRLYLL